MSLNGSEPEALLFQALTLSRDVQFKEPELFLTQRYGPILMTLGPFDFDPFTGYYRQEMGEGLQKKFYLFSSPVSLEHFYRYKLDSQSLELRYLSHGKRHVNADPGYLTLYQLGLLSTKAFSHRIYLAERIYAECTLIAEGSRFKPLPWTYPDYQTPAALDLFAEGKRYLKSLKH
jgi:hypothetical protein